jgi:hypothetical protein
VARPIFKLKGNYLAMATLGLGIIINIALRNEAQWTGGPDGMPVPAFGLFGFELNSDKHWYWVVAILLSVSVWASLSLIDSPFGRALRALHGSEVASKRGGCGRGPLQGRHLRAVRGVCQPDGQHHRALRRLSSRPTWPISSTPSSW